MVLGQCRVNHTGELEPEIGIEIETKLKGKIERTKFRNGYTEHVLLPSKQQNTLSWVSMERKRVGIGGGFFQGGIPPLDGNLQIMLLSGRRSKAS